MVGGEGGRGREEVGGLSWWAGLGCWAGLRRLAGLSWWVEKVGGV